MTWLLCIECLCWTVHTTGRCCECAADLNVDAPEPDLTDLTIRLGEERASPGIARLLARRVIDHLRFIETSEGLCGFPLYSSPTPFLVRVESHEQRHGWWPRLRDMGIRSTSHPGNAEQSSAEERPATLAERYMAAPGGLFVPRTALRRVRLEGSDIILERFSRSDLRLRAIESRDRWKDFTTTTNEALATEPRTK